MASDSEQATTKRRWRPRFSLRALLLAVVFVGACAGLWRRWEPWTCNVVLKKEGLRIYAASFSPCGRLIITSTYNGPVLIWDALSAEEHAVLTGHTDVVYAGVYSPDATRIATASCDGSARIWDAKTGQELLAFNGHAGPVFSIAFSPDGKEVATSGKDFKARILGTIFSRLSTPFRYSATPISCRHASTRRAGRDGAERQEANAGFVGRHLTPRRGRT